MAELQLLDDQGRLLTVPAVPATSAPADATFITTTPNTGLSAEFALSTLGNGILKHTGGTPAIAVNSDLPLMGAASAGAAGQRGAAPQPTAGQQGLFLRGDATWATPAGGGAAGLPGAELVAASVLSGSLSSINMGSISNAYHGLMLVAGLRSDRSGQPLDGVKIRFNGDSTVTNYYSYGASITNSTPAFDVAQSLGNSAGGDIRYGATGATAAANYLALIILEIWGYTLTTNPRRYTYRGYVQSGDSNGNLYVLSGGGLWKNTADAINQITLLPNVGPNFVINSNYALYGLGT